MTAPPRVEPSIFHTVEVDVRQRPMVEWKPSFQRLLQSSHWRSYFEDHQSTHLAVEESTLSRCTLFKGVLFEVILITWPARYSSPVHDHASNGCWLHVLSGHQLTEYVCDTGHPYPTTDSIPDVLTEGAWSFIHNDKGYHKIVNQSDAPALTVHVYSPPNHMTTYYTP